jgi:transcription antitermination factor NusA-like protein
VKTALCNFCLKSGILCPSCQRKIRSGEISDTDLKIARLLLSLEKTYPPLQDIYFHKALETRKILAIVVGQGDMARFLSYGGKIPKELRKHLGKEVRVLERGTGNRKFLEDLFVPLNIVAINQIWLPDGTTETRVILRKRGRKPPSINVGALKEIAKKLRGITLRIEFAN